MIELKKGNILETDAEALVNTVNCVGHMGKGIALQFKKAFPENFKAYQSACRKNEVQPGSMFVHETNSMWNPKYIINFPTKRHWRGKSKAEDIESGMKALVAVIRERGITSVAIPPLGCGLGGLDWNVVRPIIEHALDELPHVDVTLFEPSGAPEAKKMPVGTRRPHMTVARALFVKLMQNYSRFSYRLTLLEIQKLAYFLQEAGEPLKLNYKAGFYGPYAHNLNKVLEMMEGHFIHGYGDTQKPDVEIELAPGAIEEADAFLDKHSESLKRLNDVADTIEGFQTPYGMELISSVHWVAFHSSMHARNARDAVEQVLNWNDRKRKLMQPEHIRVAWNRLEEKGWIPENNSTKK